MEMLRNISVFGCKQSACSARGLIESGWTKILLVFHSPPKYFVLHFYDPTTKSWVAILSN